MMINLDAKRAKSCSDISLEEEKLYLNSFPV
jgi:hypothetical protein